MPNFARVPVVPGLVAETFGGQNLFPMTPDLASTWYECPEEVTQGYFYDGKTFSVAVMDVATAKSQKITSLTNSYNSYVTGGFISSALGAPFTYASQLDDQVNLSGAVTLGIDMPFACTDSQGIKNFVSHTAAQLKQVFQDGAQFKLQAVMKLDGLIGQVQSATTTDEVNQINW